MLDGDVIPWRGGGVVFPIMSGQLKSPARMMFLRRQFLSDLSMSILWPCCSCVYCLSLLQSWDIRCKYHTHYPLCDYNVRLMGIINTCLAGWVFGRIENINVAVFSDKINVISVKLCTEVLLSNLDLFTPLSLALTIYSEHSSVTVLAENVMFLFDQFETLRVFI